MSANYLRAFGESVADVPADLERWFRGMRELDERAHALQVELEGDCEKQLRLVMEAAAGEGEGGAPGSKRLKTNSQRAGPADEGEKGATAQGNFQELNEEYMGRIEKATAELLKISAEKTGIAQQMYDCVDQHIRKLDRDLRAFDTEIANERVRLGLQPAEPAGDEKRRKRREGGSQQSSEELYKAALAAANASEPTYCTCKRISFGEMIGCENPDCQIEWFHFECVGLTDETRPKGKWYCKDCRKLLGKK